MSSSDPYAAFKSSLTGEIVQSGEEGYEFGISRWSDSFVQPAKYVVFPKTNEDVAKAILFSKEQKLELAICGGGHSWSGASSTNAGLLIHLGKYFNTARCDPEKKLIYVGGGAVWKTADEASYPHGLATVAGTVNHTGVGGLTLGGGYSYLSGRFGLTLDNLVEITVVVASGEIVQASDDSHPDLFWGCRGGGCNFGVITEFVLKAHPQRATVFFTKLVYPTERAAEIADALEAWFEHAGQDEAASLVCNGRPPNHELFITIIYFYNGSAEEGRKAARILYDLGPLKEIAEEELPYVELNAQQNVPLAHGGRKYCKGLSLPKLTPAVLVNLIDEMRKTVVQAPGLKNVGCMIEYKNKDVIQSVPVRATAFANRLPSRECLLWTFYSDDTLDSVARTYIRGWAAGVTLHGRIMDGMEVRGYTNYDPEPVRDAEVVFGPNYPSLQKVKAKYDPEQVFSKWFPITPSKV